MVGEPREAPSVCPDWRGTSNSKFAVEPVLDGFDLKQEDINPARMT